MAFGQLHIVTVHSRAPSARAQAPPAGSSPLHTSGPCTNMPVSRPARAVKRKALGCERHSQQRREDALPAVRRHIIRSVAASAHCGSRRR